MSLDRPKRLGGLALAATLLVAACSSSGATSAPSAAPTAAAPSAAAPSAAEPSTGASPAESMAAGTPPTVPTADVQLQGAGATFPAPLYTSWFETYSAANPNIKIDYQAIGSGGGIKGITDQTVDFGASDAAMKDEEIAALKPGV